MRRIAYANKLARELKIAGSPTTGENSAKLWEALSNHMSIINVNIAARLYKKAGYEPFQGYPLRRL